MKCGTCDGKGSWTEYEAGGSWHQDCPVCRGTGMIGFWEWFWANAPMWLVEWAAGFQDRAKP